jgi:mono/diheme cytochrome c family protein
MRYVSMQPRLTTVQWQTEVNKMIHNFGAHADTNQIQEIVSYLSVINGMATRQQAADDDVDASPDAGGKQPDEPEPVLIPETIPAEHAQEAQRGATLFHQDCAGCHGAEGRGNGFVGRVLLPAPSDLTAAEFSPGLLSHTLWKGVPGTSMPSWRDLPVQDLNALAIFVQSLHRPGTSPLESPESLARGRNLFLQNCALCHGVLGDAKTSAATTLMPAPTNFKQEQPDFNLVAQVLRTGVPGTAMPIWKNQFSEADRMALAAYVRTLYAPGR